VFVIAIFIISSVLSIILTKYNVFSFTDIFSVHNEYNSSREISKNLKFDKISQKIFFIAIPSFTMIFSSLSFLGIGISQLFIG
jgi:hypothetical protein